MKPMTWEQAVSRHQCFDCANGNTCIPYGPHNNCVLSETVSMVCNNCKESNYFNNADMADVPAVFNCVNCNEPVKNKFKK